MKYTIFKAVLVVVAAFTSLSSFSQDLIAREAPIDQKLKCVDSLVLQRQIKTEQSEYPAFNLYPAWDNRFVHSTANVVVPEKYVIDLTGFHMPTPSRKITSKYGPRGRRFHQGLDIKVYVGDTIVSAFDGKVRMVCYQPSGYGKVIVIRHDNGLETVYGHLSKQLIKENQLVKAGEPIGLGGNTGRSSGSHLHFETCFLGKPINPAKLFDFEKQDIVAETYTFYKSGSKNCPAGSEIRYYKVKRGDSLSRIAAKNGVSVKTLCRLNRITTQTTLRVGQVLRCS